MTNRRYEKFSVEDILKSSDDVVEITVDATNHLPFAERARLKSELEKLNKEK